jgi:glycosyltransferase involved in cell wall biosynthesis
VSPYPTGTETYSRRLIAALLALNPPLRFRLFFRSPPPRGSFPGAEQRIIPFPRLWTHLRLSWEIASHPLDLLFVPAHVLPPVRPPLSVVTIHDLGYLHLPQTHPPFQRLYLDLATRWNARVATHVVADSNSTGRDLVSRYGTHPGKVSVAYPGYDERLAPVRNPAAIAAVKTRYGIPGDYFLYLGTLQPRKNLSRLISAFADLPRSGLKPEPTLVLAGRRGWLTQDIFARVRQLGLEQRVLLPGYVAEEDKAALLSGALAFAFPSLYEGFGLPVLEAQACGCPVVCSSTSSLPEVAGDGALLIDPTDVAAWTAALGQLAADPVLRSALVERGHANLQRFSWQRCALEVLNLLNALVASQQ